jgi:SPP1 family predicted phage head-tail adaptor
MGIGKTQQVKLIPYTADPNINGAWIEVRGQSKNVWAKVSNPSGFRSYQNGQTQLGETKDFLIRFRFDMFPNCNWKLVYDSRVWTVNELIKQDEKKFFWRLNATSKGNV